MGGGNKQTTTTNSTQSQKTTQKLNPFDAREVGNQFDIARNIYDQRLANPAFFEGQTFADFAPETEQALSGITNLATNNQLGQQATGALGHYLSGDFLGQTNPYLKAMQDQAAGDAMSQVASTWGRYGRGSGNAGVGQAAGEGIMDARQRLAYQDYNNRMQTQMQALGMAPAINDLSYDAYNRLGQVGLARQEQDQLGINEDMQRWQAGQDQMAKALYERQGFLNQMNQAYGTQHGTMDGTSSSTSTSQMKVSPFNQALGGLSMLGGLAMTPFNPAAMGNTMGGAALGAAGRLFGMGQKQANPYMQAPSTYGWM